VLRGQLGPDFLYGGEGDDQISGFRRRSVVGWRRQGSSLGRARTRHAARWR
jgi:RTX calcium-binding nonapeptide repeat (4 copies)